MPLIEDKNTDLGKIQQPPDIPDVSSAKKSDVSFFSDVIPAAVKLNNSIVSNISDQSPINSIVNDIDPNYDVWGDIEGTKYEPYWSDFANRADNKFQADKLKRQIDSGSEIRQIMANASIPEAMAATALAVLTDPLAVLFPVSGVYKLTKLGSRNILQGIRHLAITGAIGESVTEIALRSSQVTRSTTESVSNIAGGAFINGVIGGVTAKSLEKKFLQKIEKTLEEDFKVPPSSVKDKTEEFIDDSISAARVVPTTKEQETLKGALGLEKLLRKLSPNLRLPQSPSLETRRIGQQLLDNPLYFNKHAQGITEGAPVETLMQRFTANQVKAIEGLRGQYSAYKKAIKSESLENISKKQFDEQVAIALRNNDIGKNKFVTQAAKSIRSNLLEPLKKEAIAQKLLPKDVTIETADSYLTRIWDVKKIVANEPEFRDIVGSWVRQEAGEAVRRVESKFAKEQDSLQREVDDLAITAQREKVALTDLGEGVTPNDVLASIRQLQAPRPKKPETLLSFLQKKGGLVDEGGELAQLGITNKSRVGFINKNGQNFDDATLRAWEEGFLPDFVERPDINDLLKAIDDEFNGGILRVREQDQSITKELDLLSDLQRTIDEMGIDIKTFTARQKVIGKQADDIAKLRNRVIKLQKVKTQKRIDFLQEKLAQSKVTHRIEKEQFFDTENNFNGYVDDVTSGVMETLTTNGGVTPHFNLKVAPQGPLRERTFSIPDKMVDGSTGKMSFISNDIEAIMERYRRLMGAEIELQRKFGSVTLEKQIQTIKDDYVELAKKTTTEKQRTKLNKRKNQDLTDVEVMRDMLRGLPNKYTSDPTDEWVRAFKLANTWNYVTKLGGVAVSSFPDIARPVMTQGFRRVFADGLLPLVTNLKAVKMSVQEAKNAGAVTELILNSRLNTMADLTDPYAHGTAFERFADHTAQVFSKATGIMHWNHFWKATSGVLTQARILDNVVSGKFRKGDREYLALLGLDSILLDRIGKQFRKHGKTLGGVKVAFADNWDDEVARRAYQAAIITDVNRTIVTKGIGDVPLIMNKQVGKTLGQFKSFALAANQRVMIAGLQQRDAAMLNGVIFSITAGMAVYVLKEWEKGRTPDLSIEKLLIEGLDRSGLIPVLMEANNAAEKVALPGLAKLAGASPASRFQSRNLIGTLIGPTGGLVQDIGVSTRAIATGDVNQTDVRTMRRLIPFNNLIILRKIFDKAEESLK